MLIIWCKVLLVSGVNMTGSCYDHTYCGVVNVDNVRRDLFSGQINNLESDAACVRNSYIRNFASTKAVYWKLNKYDLRTKSPLPQSSVFLSWNSSWFIQFNTWGGGELAHKRD